MKFWDKHSEEMRKSRLLQAAAILYSSSKSYAMGDAVYVALKLEAEIEKQTKEKQS